MSNEELQKQTTSNIQEKANLIWAIADKLVGVYKPHEYGNVILPMCVIKRFEDTLAPTKKAVLDKYAELEKAHITVLSGFLETAAQQQFYNLSPFTFETLLNDPDNIADNFTSYLNHFSDNVIDILRHFEFDREVKKMADNGLLYLVIKEFTTPKAYLGADMVTSVDMGYIFEELVRKFSESYDEQAGAHFTARDIIYLMADLLVGDNEEKMEDEGIVAKKPLETDGDDYEWDSDLTDTEIIPWQQDIDEYLDKNVRPYAPDFHVDESKTRIGYEIPFTREFYKYQPLRPSSEIWANLSALEEKEKALFDKLTAHE